MLNAYAIAKLHIDEALPTAPDDPDPASPEDVKDAAHRTFKETLTYPGTGPHNLYAEFDGMLRTSDTLERKFRKLGTSVGLVQQGSAITMRIGVHDLLFVTPDSNVEVFIFDRDISFTLNWLNKFLPSGWQLIAVNDDNCRWVNRQANIGTSTDPLHRIIPASSGDTIDARGYLHAKERPIFKP